MNDEITHNLFALLEQKPNLSQREVARELGISLGKTNYCINGLIQRGCLKARNFKNSNNKIAYAYILTPTGFSEKAKITSRYLQQKIHEYETLKVEIDKLQHEVSEG
jgi:EPS-associated MarR family transcriptional regulator